MSAVDELMRDDPHVRALASAGLFEVANGCSLVATGDHAEAATYFARANRYGAALHVLQHGADAGLAEVVRLTAECERLRQRVAELEAKGGEG